MWPLYQGPVGGGGLSYQPTALQAPFSFVMFFQPIQAHLLAWELGGEGEMYIVHSINKI